MLENINKFECFLRSSSNIEFNKLFSNKDDTLNSIVYYTNEGNFHIVINVDDTKIPIFYYDNYSDIVISAIKFLMKIFDNFEIKHKT